MNISFEDLLTNVIANGVAKALGWLAAGAGITWLFRKVLSRLRRSGNCLPKNYKSDLESRLQQLDHQFAKQGIALRHIQVPVTVKELAQKGHSSSMRISSGSGTMAADEPISRRVQKSTASQAITLGEDDLLNVLSAIFSPAALSAGMPYQRSSRPDLSGAPFVVITGDPGSGKTIALRLIALRAWDLARPAYRKGDGQPHLIPVWLTSKDLVDCELDLPRAIAKATGDLGFRLESQELRSLDGRADFKAVDSALREGRFLIAIDGLDEVDATLRIKIADKISQALTNWRATPFAITCRTAAWLDHAISNPRRIVLHMQPFTSAIIRQFVRRWPFEPADRADGLLEAVSKHKHFSELARNPLSLTILCWWYDQNLGAGLPENRALFYQECCQALLRKWDLAKHVSRGCSFLAEEKEDFLSFVAEAHISDHAPGQYIDKRWIRKKAKEWGKKRDLDARDIESLVSELQREDSFIVEPGVEPSVIMSVSKDVLTFSHRTFLEFYAAFFFFRESTAEELLARYDKDRSKWQQVLLFYCGLLSKDQALAHIIRQLIERKEIAVSMTALSEAQEASEDVASRVVTAALYVLKVQFDSQVVQGFGYLLASPHKELSHLASKTLDAILKHALLEREKVKERFAKAYENRELVAQGRLPLYDAEPGWGDPDSRDWQWLVRDDLFSRFCEELVLAFLRRPSELFRKHFDPLIQKVYPAAVIAALEENDARRLASGVLRNETDSGSTGERLQLEWIDGSEAG